ncbi:ATP-binding protein [Spirosoma gilvum]
MELNLLDSARFVVQQAYRLNGEKLNAQLPNILRSLGRLEALAGHNQEALRYYREALRLTYLTNNVRNRSSIQTFMARLFDEMHQPDSSLYYARLAFVNTRQAYQSRLPEVSLLLAKLYKLMNQPDSAYAYQEIARVATDSLFGLAKFQQLQRLTLAEQQRQQQLINAQKDYQNQVRFYAVLIGLAVLGLLAIILWRNNRQQQKANEQLHRQKEEIERQRGKVEQALTELKTTQTQLIQREKMASLGELTAGIAHEIQNPLNFVNNFSELSTELIGELTEELDRGDTNEAKAIATDLTQNLQKITHHGKRASSIVKGMLEHSRTSSGQKEPTDLSALADEYLRIAYQGFRAKDKTFNAELKTNFDPDLPSIKVVPQDIGRVLLNLYNNAFYSVEQQARGMGHGVDYQPTIWVSTLFLPLLEGEGRGEVQIQIKDNGMGIPEAIKAKIFQPFFTTKPTGEGTGLGLSLSYDIVTKGHGGTLDVTTVPGEFTEFIIALPIA